MNRPTYVFTWDSSAGKHCKLAEHGDWYRDGDEFSMLVGQDERWFRVLCRYRTGDVVTIPLARMAKETSETAIEKTNAVAEFLLHLEEANDGRSERARSPLAGFG